MIPFSIIRRCKKLESLNGESRRSIKKCMNKIYAGEECHHRDKHRKEKSKTDGSKEEEEESENSDTPSEKARKLAKKNYIIKHCEADDSDD